MKSTFAKMMVWLSLALLGLTSCAPRVETPLTTQATPTADAATTSVPAQSAITDPATARFTLVTGMQDGKMVFMGSGGDVEGKVNPDLRVKPDEVVEVTLVDGDGVLHDFSIPDLDVDSDKVSGKGKQVKVLFRASKPGSFAYFCTLPGHRQAGMEGKFIVGEQTEAAQTEITTSVVRSPDDLPSPIGSRGPETVRVDLETTEVQARLSDGSNYTFWTFNGKVPGPFLRVRVGDTVEVHLKNSMTSMVSHSVDFHAVTGPGGGAVATQTHPGDETMFTFKALKPGLFVYHCATPMVAEHISNGMYGLILVEPEGGLPPVDREFYVMQGELYTGEKYGTKGENTFSVEKLLDEKPEYFLFNGAVGGLTKEHPLHANVGETVRIFFGVGGPNFVSSFHVIGEIFDRVYDQASLTSPPLTNVQTTLVPPGGATMVEFTLEVPGRFILVDHALSRMERGLAGYLMVDGPPNPAIFEGTPTSSSGH